MKTVYFYINTDAKEQLLFILYSFVFPSTPPPCKHAIVDKNLALIDLAG